MRTHYLMGTRPATTPDGEAIPINAVIVNAPRPINPSLDRSGRLIALPMWFGDWVHGPCYAAIYQDDESGLQDAENEGACILEWASREEMINSIICRMRRSGLPLDNTRREPSDSEITWWYQSVRDKGAP